MDNASERSPSWRTYGWDQIAVEKLVRAKWGDKVMDDSVERAARVAEEGIELLQAVAKSHGMKGGNEAARQLAHGLVDRAFDKEPGEVRQEASGVIVTLLAFCAHYELRLDDIANEEIRRLDPIDAKVLMDRHNAKADLGLAIRAE
jgi:hypothetical protein